MALLTEDPSNPGFFLDPNNAIVPDPGNPGFGVVNAFSYQRREHPINLYTEGWLLNKPVSLIDTQYGHTLGEITSVGLNHGQGTIDISCLSRLDDLNDYNIQAQPYIGTLEGAFQYYASLGSATVDVSVDSEIADRQVVIPGWNGDLWYHLKQLAAAQNCEISLVAGIILLRPVRTREAARGYDIQRNASVGGGQVAQSVEVYWYNTRPIVNEIVYPPNGWNPEVQVLNVNAGEDTEYELELEASLSSFQAPTMQTSVPRNHTSSSVYTVVADDGLPVLPQMWEDRGGRVEISVNPDTTSLHVKLRGAENIPLATGGYSRSFSLALADDEVRYSTLRIVGTGVSYLREVVTIPTGVSPQETSTEVGVTIDNPFITTMDGLYDAGMRAASTYNGNSPSIMGSVSRINQRADSGLPSITYGQVKDFLTNAIGGTPTLGQAKNYYNSELGLSTLGQVRDHWAAYEDDSFERQAFGNVNGARVWDQFSRRWYRIRSGTIEPGGISFSQADDDLTVGDVNKNYAGMTLGEVVAFNEGLTYQQERLAGLRATN